eukprot:2152122-Pleurochrysis_carterae.AAC.1
MAMPSEGCAGAMTMIDLERGWVSAHDNLVAVVSQYSMCAYRRLDDAEGVRLPIYRHRSRGVVKVGGPSVHLSLAGRIDGVIVVVAVVVLGEDVDGRVEAKEVAVVIGAEHEGITSWA